MAQSISIPTEHTPVRPGRRRSKTTRALNTRLLVITAAVGAVVLLVGYAWYQYSYRRIAVTFDVRATDLEKDGHWREAAAYLRRYLQLKPDDIDSRVRLISVTEQFASTRQERRNLLGLVRETQAFMPERRDMRVKLANLFLELDQPADAEDQAKALLTSTDAGDQKAGRRILALAGSARAGAGEPIGLAKAAAALKRALDDDPGDVTLASLTATLYREHEQNLGIEDVATKADDIMKTMVRSAANDDNALIANYVYQHRYQPREDARKNLDLVLARHPDNAEALYLLATEDVASPDTAKQTAAKESLLQFIKLRPTDPRGPIMLARLYRAQKNLTEVVNVLTEAHRQPSTNSLEVTGLLSEALLDANRIDDAAVLLKEFDQQVREVLPELPSPSRLKVENLSRLLHARLDYSHNDLTQAARGLRAVLASVGEADVASGATERIHAHLLLASVLARSNRLDLAAAQWKAAADESPNVVDARLKAAAAYLELGRPSAAMQQLELYKQSPSPLPEGLILLIQAQQQQQLQLPTKLRNWSEFLDAIQAAKAKYPDRWEPQIAEIIYKSSLGTEESKRSAVENLKKLEAWQPVDGELLGRVALCYQRLGTAPDANRVLEKYLTIETNPVRQAMVHAAVLVEQGQSEKAAEIVAAAAKTCSGAERNQLDMARVKILAAGGKLDAAQTAAATIVADHSRDPDSLLLGIEIALLRKDYQQARSWEDQLKDVCRDGDDFYWRYCRARRLLAQYSSLAADSQSELGPLIDGLRSDRPDWYPVTELAAEYADRRGNRRQAVDGYRLSVELGDRRPETFERLITALFADGQYNEANEYLTRLSTDQPSGERLDSLAIAIAVRQNRLDTALELAKRAVDEGSTDIAHRLWYANLLSLNGKQAEAESEFKRLVQANPKDDRVWNGLFTYLVRTKQPERARQALARWGNTASEANPALDYALGQGYELLGDTTAAEQHYRSAVSADGKNTGARIRLGRILLEKDLAAARAQFEDVLKLEPRNAEARRFLASLLAASGAADDWNRALQLLTDTAQGANSGGADDRLRAMLLTHRGRNQTERLANIAAARQILAERLQRTDATAPDLDRLLLAEIFELESQITGDPKLVIDARDTLRPLVDRDSPPPKYLIAYLELLVQHIERLVKSSEPTSADKDRISVFTNDAAVRLTELESQLKSDATLESAVTPLSFRIRLLLIQGQVDEARKRLNEFAQQQLAAATKTPDRAKVLLLLGNIASRSGFHEDAEQWYRQLVDVAPNSYVLLTRALTEQKKYSDAINVCLKVAAEKPSAEVATVLTQMLAAAGDRKDLNEQAQATIDAALKANQNNVELLLSIAVRNVSQGNYDEAIKLFRRVLDLQPNHPLALNNLATLLAERPNELVEAQKYIDRAIAVNGRKPPLLDTLGTIKLQSGKPAEALQDLEESVAGEANDPRYYLHLAVAYHRTQKLRESQEALDKAQKSGLDRTILTTGDREFLASLKQTKSSLSPQQ